MKLKHNICMRMMFVFINVYDDCHIYKYAVYIVKRFLPFWRSPM